MKQIKDKLFLPKLLRDILNVVYWFSIIGVGFLLLFISWLYISGDTNAANLSVMLQQALPVHLDINDVGKLAIDNSFYEVSLIKVEGKLSIENAPVSLVVFNMILLLFIITVSLYIINLLRKILKNISDGKQFNNENEIYIRNIGLIVIIGSILEVLFESIITIYCSTNTTFDNMTIEPYFDLNFGTVFLGFVILVISQIFKLGTEIKSEQDLTI
ncbi:MAG: DUF2975 domain-containing protein [Ignavibacteriae bacterium]|nr:DUF2975 domain-containing protein [Ignavibacteriota bacterium]